VECSLRRKGSAYLCHLVNMNLVGHNNVFETQAERQPAVEEVRVALRLGTRPKRISTVPDGREAAWREDGGLVSVEVGAVRSMVSLRIET